MDKKCYVCPRNCGTDRCKQVGFCGANNVMKIAKHMVHFWEEPIISGTNGSGAIFFSNCSLKCVFCQNAEISSGGNGNETTVAQLIDMMKELEKKGVHNINLVSPTHYTLQIIEALKQYKPNVPVVWNTSGYEKPETIELLKNYVDIFLTDFKYFSSNLSKEYSNAENYFSYCSNSLIQMRKNIPFDIFGDDGMMKKGIIVRHLILPHCFEDSIKIFEHIKSILGTDVYISLMNQYTPYYKALSHKVLKDFVKPIEYKILMKKLISLGFHNGFFQDNTSASTKFIPDFKKSV